MRVISGVMVAGHGVGVVPLSLIVVPALGVAVMLMIGSLRNQIGSLQ